MSITQQEFQRFQRNFDISHVIDPEKKTEIIKDEIKAVTAKIEQALQKRTRGGKKIVVFVGEMK